MSIVKNMTDGFFKKLFDVCGIHLSKGMQKNLQIFVMSFCVFAGVGVVFSGYRFYQDAQDRNAQLTLSRCSKQLEVAQGSGDEQSWSELQMVTQSGYQDHRSSRLAPYFLVLESHALVAGGKIKEAVEIMERAVKDTPSNSPLAGMIQLRKTLMQIDLDAQAGGTAGIADLKRLSDDINNNGRDAALFYLGLNHWSRDDIDQAQTVWNTLIHDYPYPDGSATWAAAAQQRIERLPRQAS